MLLAVLINYGLRYNYQQRVMQYAFRKALVSGKLANEDYQPSAVQHVVLKDMRIPDPANPFGVGSVMPVSGSASVTRSYTYNAPEYDYELPVVEIDINGYIDPNTLRLPTYKTAGIRQVCVDSAQENKYLFIYGAGNVDDEPSWVHISCPAGSKPMNIIDTCDGQIVNYESAIRRCRMIVNNAVCHKQCQDSGGTDCDASCNPTIETPWYCQGATETNTTTHKYDFLYLNTLFRIVSGQTGRRDMGLQQDYYTSQTNINNTLAKEETPGTSGAITTTDTLDWTETQARSIVYRNLTDTSGNVASDTIATPVGQKKSSSWQTPN